MSVFKLKFYMRRILITFLAFFSSLVLAGNNEIDSLLSVLDKTIEESKTYMEAKELRINSLKSLLENTNVGKEQEYSVNIQIYNEYRTYTIDSALLYLNHSLDIAESLKNDEWINETRFYFARLFAASGMYKESMDMLDVIDRGKLTEKQKSAYYSCFEFLYNELGTNSRFDKIAGSYIAKAKLYRDSLLNYIDKNTNEYWYIIEKSLTDSGKIAESKNIIAKLIENSHEGTAEYAYATYLMAVNSFIDGNVTEYKKYLILSAISDIKAAIKDNTSLNLLASQLYTEKDIDRAYEYVKFALEDASFFNARLRLVQVSNILPVINQAYQAKSDNQKRKLQLYLLIISVLTGFLILAVLFIYKQMKSLSKARNNLQVANQQLQALNTDLSKVNTQLKLLNLELSETNTIKEQYIGLFLSICSSYIDKLDNYRRMVNKFISSGKVSELHETTKSKQLIDKELNEFYENFDNTFLHIYPNFVEDLNTLLVDDERIVLKKGELLNTELRIFALIRLGITDSSKIASLLRYSVNTIYNYRVKIKNKASVPRDDFEKLIMKIGSFSK